VFSALDSKQAGATTLKYVGQSRVNVNEIGIRSFPIRSALASNKPYRARGKPPTVDIETRRDLSDELVLSSSVEKRGNDLKVALGIKALSPELGMTDLTREAASRTSTHDQRFTSKTCLGPMRRLDK
jgi:hypothetical protein